MRLRKTKSYMGFAVLIAASSCFGSAALAQYLYGSSSSAEALTANSASMPANQVPSPIFSADHTTLLHTVKRAGLLPLFTDNRAITVFAPTNKAFAHGEGKQDTAPMGAGELQPSQDQLKYFLIVGRYTPKTLRALVEKGNGQAILKTMNGDSLTIMATGHQLLLRDGRGVDTPLDSYAAQAKRIIFIIDTVPHP